ncbi:MAG TPA: J domain-containing protein [Rhizomicrobium sp.]|nr:J domain-containing protein [Rhizomicrobium sp.]
MASARRKTHLGDIRIKPDDKTVRVVEEVRPCHAKGCKAEGTHRVTLSREALSDYIWLCLAHARAHNEAWDFFAGMSDKEIERFQVEAVVGHRPTWPLGKRAARARVQIESRFEDLRNEPAPEPRRAQRRLTGLQLTALATLNLEDSASLHEIKARYKELVKRFHPDANGGDRGAEERLKQVIKAYSVLRAAGMT